MSQSMVCTAFSKFRESLGKSTFRSYYVEYMHSMHRVALLWLLNLGVLLLCAQGTTELQLIDELTTGISPGELYLSSAGNRLVFSHCDLATGTELWVSDGTANGSELVRDLNTGEFDSNPADFFDAGNGTCLLYTSPSPRDQRGSRMPSSA